MEGGREGGREGKEKGISMYAFITVFSMPTPFLPKTFSTFGNWDK